MVWVYWRTKLLIMSFGLGLAITISVNNFPPVAFDDIVETNMGIPITINVLNNDFDQDTIPTGQIFINTYDSTSLGGSVVSMSPDKKTFKYTPKNGWFGNDMFTYNVTDNIATSNTATVKIAVKCLPPIQEPKSLALTDNTTYTFDITNVNTAPKAIVFNNGLPDRDINTPAQTISIVPGTVVTSSNIVVSSVTNTIITFKTNPLPLGTSVGISFINYQIQNSVCGIKNTESASVGGSVNDDTVDIVQGFLGTTLGETASKKFTKYPMYDTGSNDYPYKSEGWYIFCFNAYSAPDQFYISMISKPYQNSNGIWTTDKYFHGLIGPVGDSLDDAHNGNGRFIFWKPYNCDLNIWAKSDVSSSFQIGCIQAYDPTITDVDDPARYFTDSTTRPTNKEILDCLKNVGKTPFKNTVNDYTDVYTGTATPSFISTI